MNSSFRRISTFSTFVLLPLQFSLPALYPMDAQAAPKRLCLETDGNSVRIRSKCKKGRTELDLQGLLATVATSGVTGPKGDKGDTGPQGVAGLDGTDGVNGIDGSEAAWGDGSAGDFTFTGNGFVTNDNLQFNNFTVEAGAIARIPSGTTIHCTGDFINNGTIQVEPSAAPGYTQDPVFGNNLDTNSRQPNAGIAPVGATIGSFSDESTSASGGLPGLGLGSLFGRTILRPPLHAGGAPGVYVSTSGAMRLGGGSIAVYCKGSIVNNGTITANGKPVTISASGSGGAAGGIIILASQSLVENLGAIEVKGASGANDSFVAGPGGGGGGGLIHILAPAIELSGGTTDVSGGAAGIGDGTGIGNGGRRFGGAGGGACIGDGGQGGSVSAAGVAGSATNGKKGFVISRIVPNPAGMLN